MSTLAHYRTLVRRNLQAIALYLAGLLFLFAATVYLAFANSWWSFPVSFVNGIYFLYMLLRIDDMLGLSTTVYGRVSELNETADKAAISAELETMFESYDLPYYLPDTVEVVWESDVERSSVLDEDREIITLNGMEDPDTDACRSALFFTKKTIVPHVREFLAVNVDRGLDVFVSEDIISNGTFDAKFVDKDAAVAELYQTVVQEVKADQGSGTLDGDTAEALEDVRHELHQVRDGGFFGPVLLREYSKVSEAGLPTKDLRAETRGFLSTLDEISERAPSQRGSLAFPGEVINVGVGIIGGQYHRDFYVELATKSFAKYDTTYILAEGEQIPLAKAIHEELKDLRGVAEWDDIEYTFRDRSTFDQGYCAQYEVPAGTVSE